MNSLDLHNHRLILQGVQLLAGDAFHEHEFYKGCTLGDDGQSRTLHFPVKVGHHGDKFLCFVLKI